VLGVGVGAVPALLLEVGVRPLDLVDARQGVGAGPAAEQLQQQDHQQPEDAGAAADGHPAAAGEAAEATPAAGVLDL